MYMDSFAKSIINVIGNQRQPSAARPSTQQPSLTRPVGPSNDSHCHWCGGIGHFTRECPDCKDAIAAGKCKRNDAGKIVLPNEQFVPQQILGVWIKDCIEEWHRRNPGQILAGMLAIPSNAQMPAHQLVMSKFSSNLSRTGFEPKPNRVRTRTEPEVRFRFGQL